jgi:hypothetical protein
MGSSPQRPAGPAARPSTRMGSRPDGGEIPAMRPCARMALTRRRPGLRMDAETLLLQSHGFLVDAIPDEAVGVVDDVIVDEDGHPSALVVSAGWFGRRRLTVPVAEVDEICPGDRRLRIRRSAAALASELDRA